MAHNKIYVFDHIGIWGGITGGIYASTVSV